MSISKNVFNRQCLIWSLCTKWQILQIILKVIILLFIDCREDRSKVYSWLYLLSPFLLNQLISIKSLCLKHSFEVSLRLCLTFIHTSPLRPTMDRSDFTHMGIPTLYTSSEMRKTFYLRTNFFY